MARKFVSRLLPPSFTIRPVADDAIVFGSRHAGLEDMILSCSLMPTLVETGTQVFLKVDDNINDARGVPHEHILNPGSKFDI